MASNFPCSLVDTNLDLRQDTPFGATMLARAPLAFPLQRNARLAPPALLIGLLILRDVFNDVV